MKRWMKWMLLAATLSLPAAAYAVTQLHAGQDECPITPDCPCHHK